MHALLRALSFGSFLRLPGAIPTLAGIPLVLLGAVYLFFGKRLFRLLVAAVGAAVGFEAGRLAALHFHLTPVWFEVPAALVVGGVFWPLWQMAIFLVGGGLGGLLASQAVGASAMDHGYLLGGIAGFILGGVFSVLLVKAMSVLLTAVIGAAMVFVGAVALGHGIPVVRSLTHAPVVSAGVMGLLAVAGIVAQLGQPDPDEARKRKIAEAEERAKAVADAEARERYDRYRHGGG